MISLLLLDHHLARVNSLCKRNVGKVLPDALYLHSSLFRSGDTRSLLMPEFLEKLDKVLDIQATKSDIVIKLFRRSPKITILKYPGFLTNPHPTLSKAITCNLASGANKVTDYSTRINPPILHRTEQMIDPDSLEALKRSALTEEEEGYGLYKNTRVIGTVKGWESAQASCGVRITGYKITEVDFNL